MPAPVMAAIRVRREPKMGDLSASLSASAPEARAEKYAVVNCGDNARLIIMKPAADADMRESGNKFLKKIAGAHQKSFAAATMAPHSRN